MRTVHLLPLVAALSLSAASARGQTPAAPAPAQAAAPAASMARIGEVDFGVRFGSITGDQGLFQRYRDLRDGPTLDRLRYARDEETWVFKAEFDHVGYRDQRYFASAERYGRVEASFEWNQIPLFYTDITRSPFTDESVGVQRLENATQLGVQNRTLTIDSYSGQMQQFDARSRRDIADARFVYHATRDLDLQFALKNTNRSGTQPWAASFGFSNAVQVAAPLDTNTRDVTTAAEWSNRRGMVRVAYDGSWFANDVPTLVWDNPLRLTDQVGGDGPGQGRMGLWPDSTAHTVSVSGSAALPGRSRAFAYVSVGSWLQDEQLLPHTINTAIAPIALPRQTAEAEARITSMNYRFTSRPTPMLWFSGQYRLYDYDNRTPHFAVGQYVRLDTSVMTSATGGSEPFGYTRHFVDLDASLTPVTFAAFRVGYGQERDKRTFRLFEETTEHVLRASVDSTGLAWGSVRLQYDHSVRTGDGLDEQVLSDIGEQISLRQFDISDRTRDRVSGIFQVSPADDVGLTASVSVGREHRPDAAFGLQDNDLRAFSLAVDFSPGERAAGGVSYGYENYSTLQKSRQANPGAQFNDPTRDWSTDMDEGVHTLGGTLDVPELLARTALHIGYDYMRSNAQYLYLVPANSTLTPPQQLPAVLHQMQQATVDVRYALSRQLALSVAYWFDTYDVEDFAVSPDTLYSPTMPTFFNLMYQARPYDAHTGFVRLIYNW